MPKSEKALKDEFKNDLDGQVFDFAQTSGYCLAYALFWVKCRIIGFSNEFIVELLNGRTSPLIEQKLRSQIISGELDQDHGPAHAINDLEAPVFLHRDDGLGSRKKIIKKVLSDPGVWFFAAAPKKGGDGHAVAFDTRGGDFVFFDPNTGLYQVAIVPAVNAPDARVVHWFHDYWEAIGGGGGSYKKSYKGGARFLIKYQAGANLQTWDGDNLEQIDLTTTDLEPVQLSTVLATKLNWERYIPEDAF